MFRSRFIPLLVFASLLIVSTTDLLATGLELQKEDSHPAAPTGKSSESAETVDSIAQGLRKLSLENGSVSSSSRSAGTADSHLISDKGSSVQQATGEAPCSIADLPEELLLITFSFLNQGSVYSATTTNKRWCELMNNKDLWKGYAERAFNIPKGTLAQGMDYKAPLKSLREPSFTDLGTLNGGKWARVTAVNFDGSVIVGYAMDGAVNKVRAVRWIEGKGMESLGTFNKWQDSSAKAISLDGSVIIGTADDGSFDDGSEAFRWTEATGMESLGSFNGWKGSLTEAMNSDGSVIIGNAHNCIRRGKLRAFRWTKEKGMVPLDTSDEKIWYEAKNISSDGSVIVGLTHDGADGTVRTYEDRTRAFWWTKERGIKLLGSVDDKEGAALCTNFDGSIIVGLSDNSTLEDKGATFRWTEKNGMMFLGTLGVLPGLPLCVSFDGSVIAGEAVYGFSADHKAFRWTEEKGLEAVEELLKAKGLLPPHWTLTKVTAITPNGVVLVGEGRDKTVSISEIEDEVPLAWRAVIPRGNLFLNKGIFT